MSKRSLSFVCQNCGAAASRWQGKCEACGEWNTLSEEGADRPSGPGRKPGRGRLFKLEPLAGEAHDAPRLASGVAELDRVTGGGFVRGSVLLLGGDPGIGKSTLLVQAAAALGVPDWGGGDITKTIDGYRFQVLWKVAGHYNHVHVGVRKV